MNSNPPARHRKNNLSILPASGLIKRLAALTYDTLVLAGVSLVYGMLGFAIKELVYGEVPTGVKPVGGPLLFWGWVVVVFGFYVYFWYRAGQTVGMRAWRLKLIFVDNNQQHFTGLQKIGLLVLRCILALVSFALLGLGYLWCLFDPNGETFHDKFSKTKIVVLPKK